MSRDARFHELAKLQQKLVAKTGDPLVGRLFHGAFHGQRIQWGLIRNRVEPGHYLVTVYDMENFTVVCERVVDLWQMQSWLLFVNPEHWLDAHEPMGEGRIVVEG